MKPIHFGGAVLSMLLILNLCGPVRAEEPLKGDFAYGLVLTPEETGAIYKISLPETVYAHVIRPDLGDMRVFNGQGEMVPHTLRRPESPEGETPEPVSLSFFPVYETQEGRADGLLLHITTDESGAILRTQPQSGEQGTGRISAYLIDASALEQLPDRLELDWTQEAESFVASVSVSYSDDLTRWQTPVPGATLARLLYGGHELNRQTISLSSQSARYLRLSWPKEGRRAQLTAIRGLFSEQETGQNRQYRRVTGSVADAEKSVYEFDTGGWWPADSVNISLPERNSLIRGVLRSRPHDADRWYVRCRGLFYNLTVNDTRLTGNATSLPLITDRHWRLEAEPGNGGMGKNMPVLELGWVPHDLLFLARGEGPFTLAYGSARVALSDQPVHALLRTLEQGQTDLLVKAASVGESIRLGGEAMLKPLPPPLPWKKWILWAVLVAGVALLGRMAWHLFHQFNEPEQKS